MSTDQAIEAVSQSLTAPHPFPPTFPFSSMLPPPSRPPGLKTLKIHLLPPPPTPCASRPLPNLLLFPYHKNSKHQDRLAVLAHSEDPTKTAPLGAV